MSQPYKIILNVVFSLTLFANNSINIQKDQPYAQASWLICKFKNIKVSNINNHWLS